MYSPRMSLKELNMDVMGFIGCCNLKNIFPPTMVCFAILNQVGPYISFILILLAELLTETQKLGKDIKQNNDNRYAYTIEERK